MDALDSSCALAEFGLARVRRRRSGRPSSKDGKKTTSQNARKHGCRSREKIVPGEQREDYDAMWEQWLSMYEPENAADVAQLELVVESAWRLRRSERAYTQVECKLAESSKNAVEWPADLVHKLQVMQRYRTSAENSLHKSVRLLEFLKDKRAVEQRERERVKEKERKRRVEAERSAPEAAKILQQRDEAVAAMLEAKHEARTRQVFRGQDCVTAPRKSGPPLVQWAEIRVMDGVTVTELSPSSAELLAQGQAMLPPPEVVVRKLNFPDGFPAEYAWVGVRDPELRRRGGFGTQRMTVETWVELVEREAVEEGGHLLPAPALVARPKKRQGCDCPLCVVEVEIARQEFLAG